MRRLIGSTVVLFTVAAGVAAAQDAVLLRLSGTPGQGDRYRTTVETWVKGGQMASMLTDTVQPMQQMTMWQTRTLTSAAGDTLVWTLVVDSASAAFPAAPAMAQMADQVTSMLRGLTTVTRTDRRGHIYSSQITGGPMAGAGATNSSRAFYALPEQPVRPGDTWRDSATVAGGDGTTTYVVDFRLERVEGTGGGRIAVISMSGSVSGQSAQASLSMQSTAEMRLDIASGRYVLLTMEMNGAAQGPMGEMPMRIRVSSQVQ